MNLDHWQRGARQVGHRVDGEVERGQRGQHAADEERVVSTEWFGGNVRFIAGKEGMRCDLRQGVVRLFDYGQARRSLRNHDFLRPGREVGEAARREMYMTRAYFALQYVDEALPAGRFDHSGGL